MKRLFKLEKSPQPPHPGDSCETIVATRSQRKLGTKGEHKSLRLSRLKSFLDLFHSSQEQEAQPQAWYAGIFRPDHCSNESYIATNDAAPHDTRNMSSHELPQSRTVKGKRSFFFDSNDPNHRPHSLRKSSKRTLSNLKLRRPTHSSTKSASLRGVEQKDPLLNASSQTQQALPQTGDYIPDDLSCQSQQVQALAGSSFASRKTRNRPNATLAYLRDRSLPPLRESSSVGSEPSNDRRTPFEQIGAQPWRPHRSSTDLYFKNSRSLARDSAASTNTLRKRAGYGVQDPPIGESPRTVNMTQDLTGLYGSHESDIPGFELLPASRASSLRHPFDYESYPLERSRPLRRNPDRPERFDYCTSGYKPFVEMVNAMPHRMDADTFKQCVVREDTPSDGNSLSSDRNDPSNRPVAIQDPFEDPEPAERQSVRPNHRISVGRHTDSTGSARMVELQMRDIEEQSEETQRDLQPVCSRHTLARPSRRPDLLWLEHQMMQRSIYNISNNRTASGDYYKRAAAKQEHLNSVECAKNDDQCSKLVSFKRLGSKEASRDFKETLSPWSHPAPLSPTRSVPHATVEWTKAAALRNAFDRETWGSYGSDTSMGSQYPSIGIEDTLNKIACFEKDRRNQTRQIQARRDQRRRRFWTLGIGGGLGHSSFQSQSSCSSGPIPIFNHRRTQSSSLD